MLPSLLLTIWDTHSYNGHSVDNIKLEFLPQIFLKWSGVQSDGFAAQHPSTLTSTPITKHHFPLGVILCSPMIHVHLVDLAPHPPHPIRGSICDSDNTIECIVFPSPPDWFKDKHMTQSVLIRPLGLLGKSFWTGTWEGMSAGAAVAAQRPQEQHLSENVVKIKRDGMRKSKSCWHYLSMDQAVLEHIQLFSSLSQSLPVLL